MPTLLIGEHHGIDIGQREEPGHQAGHGVCPRPWPSTAPAGSPHSPQPSSAGLDRTDRSAGPPHLAPTRTSGIPQRRVPGVPCREATPSTSCQDQQHEKRERKQQPSTNADHSARGSLLGGSLRWHHGWTGGVQKDISGIVAQIQEVRQPGRQAANLERRHTAAHLAEPIVRPGFHQRRRQHQQHGQGRRRDFSRWRIAHRDQN